MRKEDYRFGGYYKRGRKEGREERVKEVLNWTKKEDGQRNSSRGRKIIDSGDTKKEGRNTNLGKGRYRERNTKFD